MDIKCLNSCKDTYCDGIAYYFYCAHPCCVQTVLNSWYCQTCGNKVLNFSLLQQNAEKTNQHQLKSHLGI